MSGVSFVARVNGNCSRDVEDLYRTEAINATTQEMLNAYADKCSGLGACSITNYESTLVAANKLINDAGGPQDSLANLGADMTAEEANALGEELSENIDQEELQDLLLESFPPIIMNARLEFSSFTTDETYKNYASECDNVGGTVTPLNVEIIMKGKKSFATVLDTFGFSNGFEIDVDVEMKSVPICLSSSCDDEKNLEKVIDDVLKEQLQQQVIDQGNLPGNINVSGIQTVLDMASITAFCSFGLADGLETCVFTVERVTKMGVEKSDNSSDGTSTKIITNFVFAIIFAVSLTLM